MPVVEEVKQEILLVAVDLVEMVVVVMVVLLMELMALMDSRWHRRWLVVEGLISAMVVMVVMVLLSCISQCLNLSNRIAIIINNLTYSQYKRSTHFAQLDDNNVVTQVIVVSNDDD